MHTMDEERQTRRGSWAQGGSARTASSPDLTLEIGGRQLDVTHAAPEPRGPAKASMPGHTKKKKKARVSKNAGRVKPPRHDTSNRSNRSNTSTSSRDNIDPPKKLRAMRDRRSSASTVASSGAEETPWLAFYGSQRKSGKGKQAGVRNDWQTVNIQLVVLPTNRTCTTPSSSSSVHIIRGANASLGTGQAAKRP